MADYYTQCSFYLPCTADEARAIETAINEPDLMADHYFDDPDFKIFEVSCEADEEGISIWGEESAQIYSVGLLIKDLAPTALPFGFTFASTCSKPRLDAFDGGYVLVTSEGVEFKTASQMLKEELGGAKL